ncbi:MAG: CotH kinase family protein [Myxococcaceae bacterium]|nr:CotH kinase family protein [Myxococcaceae bacterium]MCI0673536.1 CotH kinase family protein [Myxococcaceae bacterium]
MQDGLDEYALVIPEATLATFNADPKGALEQPATFIHQGKSQPVMARLRGNSSRLWPKKSWKVEFPKGVRFEGREELNLLSEWMDASLMVEKLGYDLLEAMRVPAPRGRYVRLVINGKYQGIYLELENVDQHFAAAHGFADDDVTIYRCGMKNCEMKTWLAPYQEGWEKKTNEKEGDEDIRAFERLVNFTPEPELPAALERSFELEAYLRNLVLDALLSNYAIEDSQSFMVHDRVTGRWSYVPWDLNNATSRYTPGTKVGEGANVEHPLVVFSLMDAWVGKRLQERLDDSQDAGWLPIFSNLATRVALHPELEGRLLALLERALSELFTVEVLFPRIDAMQALLAPHLGGEHSAVPVYEERHSDPRLSFPEKFADGARFLKEYVTRRRNFLRKELERLRAPLGGVKLEAFDPVGGWVELRNRGETQALTAGLVLTTDLRRAGAKNVPARVLWPGQSVRFTAAQLGLTFAPEGELGLFDGLSAVGVLDVLFYGPLPPGRYYARSREVPERWESR